jgi:hypothetical protein
MAPSCHVKWIQRRPVCELPYAGVSRIRFEGFFSARQGTPSYGGNTLANGLLHCKHAGHAGFYKPLIYILRRHARPAGLLPAGAKHRTLGRHEKTNRQLRL